MRNPSGQLIWREGRPVVRVRIGERRPFFRLRCEDEQQAQKRVEVVSGIIVNLRSAGRESVAEEFAKRAASARSHAELEGVMIAVRAICEERVVARPRFVLQLRYASASAARHIFTAGEMGSRPG